MSQPAELPVTPAAPEAEPVPPLLSAVLQAWRRRRGVLAALRLAGWSTAIACVILATAMVLDLAGDPLPWARIGLAGVGLLTLLVGAAMALHRRFAHHHEAELARSCERQAGLLGEPISGALALAAAPPLGVSRWMIGRSLALAAVAADGLEPRRLLPWRTVLAAASAGLAGVVLLVVACAVHPALRAAGARALLPWRELPEPGAELLIAEPGDTWLAPGTALSLAVRAPSAMQAELAWSDGTVGLRNMVGKDGRYTLDLGPQQRDLRWRVRGPGLASAWHQARLVDVPRVATVALLVEPPAYSGLPNERIVGGDTTVIAGSTLSFEVVLEGAVASAAALIAGDQELPLPLTRSPYGGQYGNARLRVASDLDWRLRLIVPGGAGGVAVEPPQRWRIRSQADAAPTAVAEAESATVAQGRAVRIAVAGADDVGLAALWLESGTVGSPLRIALPVPDGARRAEATAILVPADLGAAPGDRLELVPVARDRAGSETRGVAIAIAVTQQEHADRHDLAGRLATLATLAEEAAAQATETERAWRAAARTWRPEDPAAGAAGLRAAAAHARRLAATATAIADQAESAGVLAGAPGNLDRLAGRAVIMAGVATALAARSATVESGSGEAMATALDAAASLVGTSRQIAASALLASGSAEAAAIAADVGSARDTLSGATTVLSAERAWSVPAWKPGLAGRFWRGAVAQGDAPTTTTTEVPAVDNRDVPGLGHNGWCARWDGEVLLPAAGTWRFRCVVDDGVRLNVAGRELLPEASWQDQGATPYEGTIELPAGWHPINMTFYQGGGTSHLALSAGIDEPVALTLDRLRHRVPPAADTQRMMAALPAGAGPAASARAAAAAAQLKAGVLGLRAFLPRLGINALHQLVEQLDRLPTHPADLDWNQVDVVEPVMSTAVAAANISTEAARILRERCRSDLRQEGASDDDPVDRLRAAAAKPGKQAVVIGELGEERRRLATLAANPLVDPAYRAAALAAAWNVDAVMLALAGSDATAARAALATATPSLALAARHARAAEAAASAALQGGAAGQLLAELALSPGWPPGLLRPARDRLRLVANQLRQDGVIAPAVQLASEAAQAAEVEVLRPGLPPDANLTAVASLLRDQTVQPTPDLLIEAAELFDRAERHGPEAGSDASAMAGAIAARRSGASRVLADSSAALATAAAALTDAGQSEAAARAANLAELGRTVAASPDATVASGLAEALQSSLAGPLAASVADGRIQPGSPAAQVGRIAAQAAAAAAELATLAALPEPEPAGQVDDWARAADAAAAAAAEASAAVDFPEEHRAAIRAYLRRLGDGR